MTDGTSPPRSGPLPSGSDAGSAWAQAGPLLLLAGVIAFLAWRWEAIPDSFVSHWGAGFQPDGWSERTVAHVFALPLYGLFLCLMLAVMARALVRQGAAAGAEPRTEVLRRRAAASVVVGAEWLVALSFATLSLFPLAQERSQAILLLLAVLATTILGSLILLIFVAIRVAPRFDGWVSTGGGDPEGWRWSVLYWNPDDPSLFVRQRIGIGYTANLARPEPWLWALTFVAGTLALLWAL